MTGGGVSQRMRRAAALVAAGREAGVPEYRIWPALAEVLAGKAPPPGGFFDPGRVAEILAALETRSTALVAAAGPDQAVPSVIPGVSVVPREPEEARAPRPVLAASSPAPVQPEPNTAESEENVEPRIRASGVLNIESGLAFPPLPEWLATGIARVIAEERHRQVTFAGAVLPWQLRYFAFRRWAKGHPELIGLDATAAWDAVCRHEPALIQRLGVQAGPRSNFNGDGIRDADEAFTLWIGGWDDVASPRGWDRITLALRYALAAPLPIRDLIPRAGRTLALVASAAAWLQVARGLDPICLPRDAWARQLNITQPRMTAIVRVLLQHDLLRPVNQKAIPRRFKALDYRFNCEQFPLAVRHLSVAERGAMDAAFNALEPWRPAEHVVARERARLPDLGTIGGHAICRNVVPLKRPVD